MDIFAFIYTPDPTKVRVVEREQNEDEPRLLDTTIGCTVPLLPVAPDRAESELEASVGRLFDERGSGNQIEQGDSAGGGQGANIQPVVEAADTVVEDVTLVQSRRQGKRKSVVVDTGGASHPPKTLREDHGTLSGTSVGGKSRFAFKRLLVGAVLNAKVGVAAIPTLPFVTASVSSTLEREVLRSYNDNCYYRTSTVDPALVAKEKPVKLSLFSADSSSAGGTYPNTVYVPQWSVTNGSRLDDGRVCREMVDEFAPPKFLASVRGMEHDQLFTEFNVRAARQMSLSAEVRMRVEYNVKEKRRSNATIVEGGEKSLRDETNALKERNVILGNKRNALDVKVTELETSAASKKRELTDLNALLTSVKSQNDNLMDREKFYPHLLTTIFGRRWLLTHGMELAIVNCLNSPEYLSALGAAIGKAIKKGMQDGLSAGITHGKEGRVLTDVDAYNPSAEAVRIMKKTRSPPCII
ncbi:hypothetical protein Tco_0702322 [Tanacetum coccineum]|uniref:Transposase (Putative), gypsy type n=1 Tax=Tanacetum coccineum TaxID=301880 RepID=A0ABQ4XX86_9ASTR